MLSSSIFAQQIEPSVHSESTAHTMMLSLDASVQKDVEADSVRLVFSKQVTGSNQQKLTKELNKSINAVINKGKTMAALQVSNGSYGFWQASEHGKEMRWEMKGEVIVTSKDFQQAKDFIAMVKDEMSLDGISFFLSEDTRKQVENSLIENAVEGFKSKAEKAVKSFGFQHYRVIKANVASTPSHAYGFVSASMLRASPEEHAVELSASKIQVSLTIEGTVEGY